MEPERDMSPGRPRDGPNALVAASRFTTMASEAPTRAVYSISAVIPLIAR